MSSFDDIAAERHILADLVAALTPDQLATPSLCDAWTVKDIAAHLLMPLVTPGPAFLFAVVRSGGNFNRASERLTAEVADHSQQELCDLLHRNAESKFHPPGMGPEAPLTDVLVHGQDLRRPLGIVRSFDENRLRTVLDFLASPAARRGFVPKSRLVGLRLQATDLDWSAGDGSPITGPAEALMMAMAGRRAAIADLTGDGVAVLSARP